MREIEIKARVHNTDKLLVRLKAMKIGLSEPNKQHDVVYSRPGAIDNDPNENWLRVRTENDSKVILTLKRSVTGELDSIEHEVVVDSEAEIVAIIGYLGYELFSDLTKVRRKAHYGEIEICYDEVPGLGNFIEAELLVDENANYEATVQKLWDLLTQLGIEESDEETHGYDVLLHNLEMAKNGR